MYKVSFSNDFYLELEVFLRKMKNYFLLLYSDTGIPNQDIILQGYEGGFESLRNSIMQEIRKQGEAGLLGRKVLAQDETDEYCSNVFYVQSYRIDFFSYIHKESDNIIINKIKITH